MATSLLPHYVDECGRNLHEINQDAADETFMRTALQSNVSDDNNYHVRYESMFHECLDRKKKNDGCQHENDSNQIAVGGGKAQDRELGIDPANQRLKIDPANQRLKIVLSDVEPEKMKQVGDYIKMSITV